jgi:hypothetical protein
LYWTSTIDQEAMKRNLSHWTKSFLDENMNYFKEVKRGEGSSSRSLTLKLRKTFSKNSNLWNIWFLLFWNWLVVFWQTFAPLYHNFGEEGKREGNFLIGFQLSEL